MSLKKNLGLFTVFCIASGAMISSGLFVLPGLAHQQAGSSVILSYLIAGLISLPGMLSLAEMTTAMPKAGGDCFTVIRSMGPAIGTVSGILSWFSLSMKSAFALIGMSAFLIDFIQIDIRIAGIAFCILFVVINILGTREAGLVQILLVVGLIGIMIVYIIAGFNNISTVRYAPFMPNGPGGMISTAGFVFVSYGGLLKIASMAEEIRNPGRTIPLGMITSLIVVSLLYALMVFITIGVLPAEDFHGTLKPISEGAAAFLGRWGYLALSVAAVLAFLSTANAGIMTAARSLIPLADDDLFPRRIGKINNRFKTPHNALLLTGFFIVCSLFLQLKILVEAASLVLILINVLLCISVIILRESKLQSYRPQYKAPFYPYPQIVGIVLLCILIIQMGIEALLISIILIFSGVFTYWFYGRIKGYREYALLHLIANITNRKLKTGNLEQELRDILHQRDNIHRDDVAALIENADILDSEEPILYGDFFRSASECLSRKLNLGSEEILAGLMAREREGSTAISPHTAIPHIVLEGEQPFTILLARNTGGIYFSEKAPGVKSVFILAGSRQERNLHLVILSAIAQIVQEDDFEFRWDHAGSTHALRSILLLGKRKRS